MPRSNPRPAPALRLRPACPRVCPRPRHAIARQEASGRRGRAAHGRGAARAARRAVAATARRAGRRRQRARAARARARGAVLGAILPGRAQADDRRARRAARAGGSSARVPWRRCDAREDSTTVRDRERATGAAAAAEVSTRGAPASAAASLAMARRPGAQVMAAAIGAPCALLWVRTVRRARGALTRARGGERGARMRMVVHMRTG